RRPRGGPAPTVRALRVPDTTKPARLWITAPACGVRRRSAGGGGAALLLGRAARAAPRFRLRPRRRVGLRGGGAVGPAVPGLRRRAGGHRARAAVGAVEAAALEHDAHRVEQ